MKVENLNYYQIYSYIQIVSSQLELLSNSEYFKVEQLNSDISKNMKYIDEVRGYIVSSIFTITKYFITSSYDDILKNQDLAINHSMGTVDYDFVIEEVRKILSNPNIISIDNIRPSMVLFNEDGMSVTIILTGEVPQQLNIDSSNDPRYKEFNLLKTLYNSNSIKKNELDFVNFENLTTEDYLKKIERVLNINKPMEELLNIVKSYVFTKDNFFKLVLINLRLRTEIPVILLGETGCGKTSLIKIIAELKGVQLHIFNIHAGIDDDKIIKYLESEKLFSDNEKENTSNDEKTKSSNTWLFIDEFNACSSVELIAEIILKHSCKGRKLKENIKIIAACNPYRKKEKKMSKEVGLYNIYNSNNNNNLVYIVYPIPHPILNFIFNFATPKNDDIIRYINTITSETIKKLNTTQDPLNEIKKIASNSIAKAHFFIKKEFDISSVSLRELNRWSVLYQWDQQQALLKVF
ncbi:P-loop containing nucleoside triphosphate hydrolase protein [Piromyces finnis]|uniref:p-loop containing nucleoside triphosphate hydrolase protein n=1 Tax=Piromyces finnis TaxID=1754191 RepID=A0A1Y1UZN4_9FUNG|nr:P-loop containing nucleoside triphosphate hydrolase protein [Piromyces finnis]|eukprot:ORX43503.1 P-loop containing nucleoside triphosphate hydrolase protein [Piromyces finnis]